MVFREAQGWHVVGFVEAVTGYLLLVQLWTRSVVLLIIY